VAINHKFDAFPPGAAVYDVERGQNADIRPMLVAERHSVAVQSWGWVEGQQYKDIRVILGDLLDVVSKNGALLLNVGPKPDGSFEAEERELLCGIGDWLAVNGEAIYGTRPFAVSGEGPPRSRTPFSAMRTAPTSPLPTSVSRLGPTSSYADAPGLAPEGLLIKSLAEGSPHCRAPSRPSS
jgi:alpha-L-fucosidase